MRVTIIEGSPQELADYERRTGLVGQAQADANSPQPGVQPLSTGERQAADETSSSEEDALRSFISGRAREQMTASRVQAYVHRVLELGGTEVTPGRSRVTQDGHGDYLHVYNAGPRTHGDAAGVNAKNADLTLRLTREDVADITDPRITFRAVAPTHQYQIKCPLRTDDTIDLAVELTKRALDKIRGL